MADYSETERSNRLLQSEFISRIQPPRNTDINHHQFQIPESEYIRAIETLEKDLLVLSAWILTFRKSEIQSEIWDIANKYIEE